MTAAPVPQQAAPAVDAAQPAPGGPAGPPVTTAAQGAVPAQPVAQAGDPAAAGPPRTAEEQATGAAVTAAATGADKAAQETTPAAEAGPAADVPAPPVADAAQGEAVPETTPAHPAVADGPSDAPAGPADGAAAATPEAAGDPQPAAATGEGPAPAPDAAAPADAPADAEPADTPVPAPAPPSSDGQDTPPVPGAAPCARAPAPRCASATTSAPARATRAKSPPTTPGADGAAPAPAPAAPGEATPAAPGEATPAAAPSTAGAVSITPAPAGAPSAAAVPPAAEAAAVHRLMREPRDVRDGFLPDPIPHEVLLRVLESAHTAPTSGHAQPWDFVIIRSAETRTQVHELAVRQHDAYAKSLPKGRAKQFKELKTDAILRTPVNIVVTADPTRGGRHATHPQQRPQLAPYSSALAVENLWLAARAEGLGVGWVSFYDERELVRTLDLPEHLEIVAYLCIGYVDAFAEETEPVPAGPARQRPLSWVVHDEAYGRRALPGAEPHDLLTETLEDIRPLDAQALAEAWERQKRMTKPAGALGALEVISAQLCGLSRRCPPPLPEPAAVAVFAGDHGVHAQGVTPWPQEVTGQMVANFLGGGAVCNAFAQQVGAEVCVIDVGVKGELPGQPGLMPRKVRAGTGDITAGPAMSREEALRAVEVGIETARDLVAAGNRALLTGEMGIANTTVAAALIAVFTGSEPAEVTGRGTGVDDDTHVRKIDVVRRALQRHQPDAADPIGVLAAVGGLEHAALTGFILGGASLRVPVILDGVSAGAAALTARAIAPEAVSVCVAGHRSAEPGHMAALTALGLRPLVDLDLRLGEGTGALLALPVVQSAARAMREVATFDAAGVSDKN
ncbi:nicotinate-nucleotide--dimethylbenzimidazole phosphoribosyltransferase [Streptomyces harbinensis]|uniref:nicotinate-nucleotide--dimethylbenzimidazole phosphoribosyltransferase n=1 Tax=Streptomyces harbinensis TaxID=1176198 RepID=UPI00248356FE|nr:nicotinate-nucleotide--dimethylbenzimidazole phosphoribosyltransferase [Streptomyces harbinensis]